VSNEPVAWMHQNPDYPISKHSSLEYNIPLYTHPAKTLTDDPLVNFKPIWQEKPELTLTDEEIMDESFKAGLAISKDTDVFLLEHDVEALVTFAKAILKKAQEK